MAMLAGMWSGQTQSDLIASTNEKMDLEGRVSYLENLVAELRNSNEKYVEQNAKDGDTIGEMKYSLVQHLNSILISICFNSKVKWWKQLCWPRYQATTERSRVAISPARGLQQKYLLRVNYLKLLLRAGWEGGKSKTRQAKGFRGRRTQWSSSTTPRKESKTQRATRFIEFICTSERKRSCFDRATLP